MAKTAKVRPTDKFAGWKVAFGKTRPNTLTITRIRVIDLADYVLSPPSFWVNFSNMSAFFSLLR